MKHKLLPAIAGVVSAALILAGCSSSPSGKSDAVAGEPVRGGTLTIGTSTNPQWSGSTGSATENVHQNATTSARIFRNQFDSLVSVDYEGNFHPWLATSWKISDDGLQYTFSLRNDVTFHDGDKFDANAVKTTFDTELNPSYAAEPGKTTLKTLRTVEVVDPTTVRFTLSERTNDFLLVLAGLNGAIVSPTSITSPKAAAGGINLVGSGPFILESVVSGQDYIFKRNDAYNWPAENAGHSGPAYIEKLHVKVIPEASALVGALSSGQVDIIDTVQPTDLSLFEKDPEFQAAYKYDNTGNFSYFFNVTSPITSDIRVRQAIRDAVDLKPILTSAFRGIAEQAWSAVSHTNADYDSQYEGTWGANIERANAQLDAAGWTGRDGEGYRTKDGQRLTLRQLPEPSSAGLLVSQAVQSALKENVGVEVSLIAADNGTKFDLMKAGAYEIAFNGIGGIDAFDILTKLYGSGQIVNFTHVADPQLDGLITAINNSATPEQSSQASKKVQAYIVKDTAASWPLYELKNYVAAKAEVQNLEGVFSPVKGAKELASYNIWLNK